MFGKKRISVCFIDSSNLCDVVIKAADELNKQYGDVFDMHIIALESIGAPDTQAEKEKLMEEADLVLVDIRGTNPLIANILKATRKGKAVVASLLGGSFELMGLTRMGIFDADKFFNGPMFKKISAGGGNAFSNMSVETDFDDIDKMLKEKMPGFVYKDVGAWFEVTRYWGLNGIENVKRLLIFMGKNYCRVRKLPKPLPPLKEPSPAIRHPKMDKLYTDLQEYLDAYGYDPEKPTVVTVSYDGMHFENCLVPTRALIEELEPDVNVVPITCDGMKNVKAVRSLVFPDGKFFGDILVDLVWFRFNGGPLGGTEDKTYDLFNEMNVPVFHPITAYKQEFEIWKNDKKGVHPIEFLANVTLPESDGMTEPIILCANDRQPGKDYAPIIHIPDRVKRCSDRIKKVLELKQKDNAEKKISLIAYNYPPGENNLGNAAYLDTFESIRAVLVRMKEEGYTVGDIPENLSEVFLNNCIVNSPEWGTQQSGVSVSKAEYDEMLAAEPKLKEDIEKYWGAFPGPINTMGESVFLPMLQLGNIMVALQPSRGLHEDEEKNYHDKSIPPHHQYAAFYKWMQKTQDAIVHVGTHGTLEFLRGKEEAISADDDMDILLGNLPHFYIYQVGNPSEAMIAKRRTMAVLIGYATPSADSSGLYGTYLEMKDLFDELADVDRLDPQRRTEVERQIREQAEANDWGDLNGDISQIEARLTAMSRELIPVGLHTFGTAMDEDEKVTFISSAMRYDRGNVRSLNRLMAERRGLKYDKLLDEDSSILAELDADAKERVRSWLNDPLPDTEYSAQYGFAKQLLGAIEEDHELDGLVNALNVGYAGAGLAADPLRNPEVYPSGRNLYQFNPLTLPSRAAVERGKRIAKNTLEQYMEKNGSYPESVGVVLWGFETAKTCGETVGQIFEYLGIKVATDSGSWFPLIEVVPTEEMEHPRIDVMIEICGFFRDLFPNLIDIIDDAVRAVSELPEENAVSKKCNEFKKSLLDSGLSEKEADELSKIRIFGPPESEYGTSLTTMIETGRWTDEKELGAAYANDMCFAYGRNRRGKPCAKVNELMLSKVEMISQIQDTYEYDVTDLDHYYEFFGGFAKAVENAGGSKPQMLATNTASEKIRTEDVSKAINMGAATRTLNPKWIDAMLEHDYHGAQKVADRVQYLVGLSATTGAVEQGVWERTAQSLVFDEEMRKRLEENNRFAAQEIAKRLYEADKRKYWQPTPEEEEELMKLLMDYEENLEGENEDE